MKAEAPRRVPRPFLKFPFPQSVQPEIAEGWLYSAEERAIHGQEVHHGIDFAVPRGTPVCAAADGLAIASYHLAYSGQYQNKNVGFGLGLFVQIWHPDRELYTCYAHLESIESSKARFFFPSGSESKEGLVYYPDIVHTPLHETLKKAKPVKQGEQIGEVGDSGLSWGYQEAPFYRPNPKRNPSWDKVHLHFEVYTRDADGRKKDRFDPFGIYGLREEYTSTKRIGKSLWLMEEAGKQKSA